MNALLIINSKNNNFAVLYKDIENILEKFSNFSNQESKNSSLNFFKNFIFDTARKQEFFTEFGEKPHFEDIIKEYNVEAIFTYFEEIKKISFATLDENKQIKESDDLEDFFEQIFNALKSQNNTLNLGENNARIAEIDEARGNTREPNQQIKRESSQTYTRSVESGGQNDTGDLRNNGFAQEDSTKENIFKDARKDYEKFTPKENIRNEQSFRENRRFEGRDGKNGEYLESSGSNTRDDGQNKQRVERDEQKPQNAQSRTNERTNEEIKEFRDISSRDKFAITESQVITRTREYQQRISTLLQSQFANGIIQRTLEALRSAKREQNPRESTNRLEKKATQNYHTNPRFNGGEARSAFGNERQGGELESAGGFQQLDRNNIQPNGEQQQGKREFASKSKEISTSKTDRGPYRNNNAGDKRGDYATTRDDGQQSNEFSSSQVKQAGKQNSETNPTSKDEFADKLSDSKDISDLPSNETIQKEFNQANIPQELKRTNNAIFIQIHQNLKIQIITMEQNEKLERKWEVLTNKSSKIWSLIYLLMIEGKLYTNKILINKKSCKMHKAEELENLKQKIETMDQENLKLIVDSYKNREAIDLEYLLNTNF